MAYEPKDNSGAIFKNSRKQTDQQPDYRGDCLIGGTQYWISCWLKTSSKSGEKFFSVSFTEKTEAGTNAEPKQTDAAPDNNDDVPF